MFGAVESGMFASALGANMSGRQMAIEALGSPERKSAAYPARALAPGDDVSMFASLAPHRGQAPLQQRVPAHVAAPAAGPQQQAAIEGMNYISTATTSQRTLSIRNFDGTELYRGLGSSFSDWERTFLRAIKLAESSCGFLWSEDVKVDLPSHFLLGTGERYYHKQVDTTTDARLRHVSAAGDILNDDHGQTTDEALHDEERGEANVVGTFPLHGRRK
uniref:RxLR effector candidate protein n=1 Tax=Hyaloperonospora arabidopsidis (strain Emoy2) TaxID=559515 RepID=A0A090BGN7_HYAAE|nr:RxLR effector candidate protein [Hyaloperonospora arabidopsidis Emoy2]